jgi:cytochrome c
LSDAHALKGTAMKPSVALILAVSALAGPAHAAGDAVAGKVVFRKCAACHSIDPVNRVGPSLAGIVGRPVASVDGFGYSKAMGAFGEGGKVWDDALLSEYLLAPRAVVKGTAMAFVGLKKPADIADLIAFLKDPAAVK